VHVSETTITDGRFELHYDGPALDSHEMDVRDLAPALLSAGELVQDINQLLRPGSESVTVNIRATGDGSFVVNLVLAYDDLVTLLNTDAVDASVKLTALLGTLGSLMRFIKNRRGRRVIARTPDPTDPDVIKVDFGDGVTLEVPRLVLEASDNVRIRRHLEEVVRPLARDGVDSLTIRRDSIEFGRVDARDLPAFSLAGTDADGRTILSDSEREVYLTIRAVNFQPGSKWRLTDGAATFTATIIDAEFLARIEGGESFSKLDVLRCRLREVQWRDSAGLHIDREITQLIAHQAAPVQLEFRDDAE